MQHSWHLMHLLTFNPKLGHITTFGGHPISCSASKTTLEFLLSSRLMNQIEKKEELFRKHLQHTKIKEIRGKGLMLAIEFCDEDLARKVVEQSIKNGLILFYFLFTKTAIRITPPLTISEDEIIKGCNIILESIK